MQYVRQFKNMDLDSFRTAGIDLIKKKKKKAFPLFYFGHNRSSMFSHKKLNKRKVMSE